MNDDSRMFCVKCGARMPQDSAFCPECGNPVGGGCNPYTSCGTQQSCCAFDSLKNTGTFITIYGIIGILIGLMMTGSGAMMTEGLWDEMMSMYPGADIGMTIDQFKDLAIMLGAMVIASGACALVSGFLVGKRRMWVVSLVLCIAASILSFGFELLGIVTFAIGMLMAFRVYQNKDTFEN